MSTIEKIKKLATSILASAIAVAPDNGRFRFLTEIKTDRGVKPLLIVGTTHGKVEDGFCIAILNPDSALLDEIKPCTAYERHHLVEIVSKRCDLMVQIWDDTYKEDGVTMTVKYVAQSPQPAKFCFV